MFPFNDSIPSQMWRPALTVVALCSLALVTAMGPGGKPTLQRRVDPLAYDEHFDVEQIDPPTEHDVSRYIQWATFAQRTAALIQTEQRVKVCVGRGTQEQSEGVGTPEL